MRVVVHSAHTIKSSWHVSFLPELQHKETNLRAGYMLLSGRSEQLHSIFSQFLENWLRDLERDEDDNIRQGFYSFTDSANVKYDSHPIVLARSHREGFLYHMNQSVQINTEGLECLVKAFEKESKK